MYQQLFCVIIISSPVTEAANFILKLVSFIFTLDVLKVKQMDKLISIFEEESSQSGINLSESSQVSKSMIEENQFQTTVITLPAIEGGSPKNVTTITVPCETKLNNFQNFEKNETIIRSIPNPAWREAASQLERGKISKVFYIFHIFGGEKQDGGHRNPLTVFILVPRFLKC